ncbi:MAG: nuclear transport factor 2 family protein [Henriciella sp.]
MKYFIGTLAMTAAFSLSPIAHASPEDEAAITTIVESVGTLADRGEFTALERLYAPEVMIDYSSLSGQPAEIKSPQGLMTEWASVLPGFDRTRHALSSIQTQINSETATATAAVAAGHWINDAYWQVDGQYDYQFAHDGQAWKITSMTFTVTDEIGSRDVFGPAIEAASKDPSEYILRQQTRAVVMDFLTGLEEKDMAKVNSVWADDAVQDMPYVPSNFPSRVTGKEALIAQYAAWPEVSGAANFTDHLVFYPMQDPRTIFVEYRGEVDIIPTGETYRQTYGGLFHVDEGKITLFREYFDPREFARAFGMEQ